MNIFWLSVDFFQNAELYHDSHVVKIILEITQCLFSCLHHRESLTGDASWQICFDKVYKLAHKNHPVVLWLTEHPANFCAGLAQGLALCHEYTQRYSKIHKCQQHLQQMLNHVPVCPVQVHYKPECVRATLNIPPGCTPVPMCMPLKYHVYTNNQPDLTASYQNYYNNEKLVFKNGKLAKWSVGTVPDMFVNNYFAISYQSVRLNEIKI